MSRGHAILIGDNGAITIPLSIGDVVFTKVGVDGQGVGP